MELQIAHVEAVLLACAKPGGTRPALAGLHIDENNIVGTDGHRLHVVAHGGDWGWDATTIPYDAVKRALQLARAFDAQSIGITPTGIGDVACAPITLPFPHYQRVVPVRALGRIAPVVANLDADYLRDAQRAIQMVTGVKLAAFSHVGNDQWYWAKAPMRAIIMGTDIAHENCTVSLEEF